MTIGNSQYAADLTVWFQYEISTANNVLVLTDTVLTDEEISLDAGLYLVATDESTEPSAVDAFSYLLTHIETKINAAVSDNGGSYTYSFGVATPSESTAYGAGAGVELSTSDGSDFTLEFGDSAFTAHKGIFGYYDHLSVAQSSTSGTFTGQGTQWGRWQAPPNHYPHDLRLDLETVTYSTGGSPQTRGTLQAPETRCRRFDWFHLPAGCVRAYSARDAALAASASLAQDDINNALQDAHAASGARAVIAYGKPSTAIDPWEVSEHEVVYLPTGMRMSAAVGDTAGASGERYDVEAEVDIVWQSVAAIIDPYLG